MAITIVRYRIRPQYTIPLRPLNRRADELSQLELPLIHPVYLLKTMSSIRRLWSAFGLLVPRSALKHPPRRWHRF